MPNKVSRDSRTLLMLPDARLIKTIILPDNIA